jgi:replicative DNA helicase
VPCLCREISGVDLLLTRTNQPRKNLSLKTKINDENKKWFASIGWARDWRIKGATMSSGPRAEGIDPKLPAREDLELEIVAAFFYGHKDARFIFDMLTEECFEQVHLRKIFTVAKKLYAKGRPFDPVAVSDAMDRGDLAELGGLQGLAEIPTGVGMFTKYDVEHACRALTEKAQQRALIRVTSKIQAEAWEANDRGDMERLLESAIADISKIGNQSDSSLDDATDFQAGMGMLNSLDDGPETVRIDTGIKKLDEMTGGFRAGELIVITAETGTGKTLLASQIKRVSCPKGWHCLFANGEMLARHLRAREVSVRSKVPYEKFRHPEWMSSDDREQILRTVAEGCKKCRIMEGDLTINRIRGRARKYFSNGEISFLIVDYDELVEAPGKDEFAEQKAVVHGLKSLALELKMPIVLISQLRKSMAKEDRAKPTLSRLYGSGSKVKTASIILHADRPFVQDLEGDETAARIVILKNRDGKVGSIECAFNVRTLEFEDKPTFEQIRIP